MGKVKAHQSFVRLHDGLVDLEVGGTTAKTLHVDTPFAVVQPESVQGPSLAGPFDSVNVLITAVVSGSRITFAILVTHG